MSKIAPLALSFDAGLTAAGNQRTGRINAKTGKYGTYIEIDCNPKSEKSKAKNYSIEQFIGIADALGVTKGGAGQKFLDRLTKLVNEGYTFEEGGEVVKPAKPEPPKAKPVSAKASSDDAVEALKGLDPAVLAAVIAAVKQAQA